MDHLFDIDFNSVFDAILSFFMFPLHIILTPVDYLLKQIPNIDVIPNSISAIVGYVGNIPSTIVSLTGISPVIWNAIISTLLLYFAIIPVINGLKKLINWRRG